MTHKVLAVFIICMILSAGCAPITTPTPTAEPTPVVDLLADTTCAKPCVLNITPGITTLSEAWTILQGTKLGSDCEQRDLSIGSSARLFIYCHDLAVSSYHADGIVDSIFAHLSYVSLEQLLARYGPPDVVNVILMPHDPGSSGPDARVRLLFQNIRAWVDLVDQQAAQFEMSPETPAYSIFFVSERFFAEGEIGEHQDWHGYGSYCPWGGC